jgi:predicted MPP superfamily phosphohydrolase
VVHGEKVTNAFEQNGIRVLENDVAEIKCVAEVSGSQDFPICGRTLSTSAKRSRRYRRARPSCALTHNPDIFPRLPSSVPLLLAAHTHGGQVTFPLIGAAVVPSDFGQKYTAGHVYENGHHLLSRPESARASCLSGFECP